MATTTTDITSTGTTTTLSAATSSKDYDWVLPVVILLFILITILFVLVLLLLKRVWWLPRKRGNPPCCDNHQGIELDDLESRHQKAKGCEEHSNSALVKSSRNFSANFNTTKNTSTSFGSEVCDFRNHYKIKDEYSAKRSHSSLEREVNSQRGCNKLEESISRGVVDCDKNAAVKRNNKHSSSAVSNQSFENNFCKNDHATTEESVHFYISKGSESTGMINPGYWDSDSDSEESSQRKDTHKLIAPVEKFEKSTSYGVLRGKSEEHHHNNTLPLDRQLSNISAPVYSHSVEDSPKLGRPLGKFETIYNLATTDDLAEGEISPIENSVFEDDAHGGAHRTSPRAFDYQIQIPTIVLPRGGYIDFDDHRHEDSISYYNSSSLESCYSATSGQSHMRIARANDPFNIEGVNLHRPSSAPCLFPLEHQAHGGRPTRDLLISRSTSVGHALTPDTEENLFRSGVMMPGSSSSWSSEFFELIREAGVTDSDTQRRMKKLIDDRYTFLFDKKYPELQSLYSSVQLAKRQTDYAAEKRSFSKHRKWKARAARKHNSSIDSDGYDRLKPPQVIYSEVRPPAERRSRYEERRNSASKSKRTRMLDKSVGIESSGKTASNTRPAKDKTSNDAAFSEDVTLRHNDNYDHDERGNSGQTVYDIPWDIKFKKYGAFRPIHSFGATDSKSSPIEPQYEFIQAIRSHSSTDAPSPSSIDKANTAILYDRMLSELKNKESQPRDSGPQSKNNTETTEYTNHPTPPTSPPPKIPSKSTEDSTTQNNSLAITDEDNSEDEKNLDKVRELFRAGGLSSATTSVTDFPPDPIWRRSSNADMININKEPFDSETFCLEKFERSTSFLASSCDTPLEHPSSDEDALQDDNGNDSISRRRSRGQSFYKDVMYTHTGDVGDSGKDEIGDEDSGSSGSSPKPFQRMKLPEEYEEPGEISRV